MPFIRPLENSIFNIFDPECIGFSHLNKHRFRRNYQECLNPLCTCRLETKNTCHHLLHGYHYTPFRIGLTDSINKDFQTVEKLKFSYMETLSVMIIKLSSSINYIRKTERFDCLLLSFIFYLYFLFVYFFFISCIICLKL